MECFNCSKTDEHIEKFYSESLTCSHCSEEMEIIYYVCLECGAVCKTFEGEVVSGVVFEEGELEKVLGCEMKELFSMLSEDKFFKGDEAKSMDMKEYLSNFVPKCIRCEARAYQVEECVYRCSDPECGFEWEVVGVE